MPVCKGRADHSGSLQNRTSYSLAISLVISLLLGVFFWIICFRSSSEHAVDPKRRELRIVQSLPPHYTPLRQGLIEVLTLSYSQRWRESSLVNYYTIFFRWNHQTPFWWISGNRLSWYPRRRRRPSASFGERPWHIKRAETWFPP